MVRFEPAVVRPHSLHSSTAPTYQNVIGRAERTRLLHCLVSFRVDDQPQSVSWPRLQCHVRIVFVRVDGIAQTDIGENRVKIPGTTPDPVGPCATEHSIRIWNFPPAYCSRSTTWVVGVLWSAPFVALSCVSRYRQAFRAVHRNQAMSSCFLEPSTCLQDWLSAKMRNLLQGHGFDSPRCSGILDWSFLYVFEPNKFKYFLTSFRMHFISNDKFSRQWRINNVPRSISVKIFLANHSMMWNRWIKTFVQFCFVWSFNFIDGKIWNLR